MSQRCPGKRKEWKRTNADAIVLEITRVIWKQKIPLKRFQKLLGKLQHAAGILPAVKSLFVPLNVSLRDDPKWIPIPVDGDVRYAMLDFKNLIRNLAAHPTHVMELDTDHFNSWKEHLEAKEGINDIANLMDHFVHNKEAWRRHISMYTPRADEHMELIQAFHTVIFNDKALRKYRTEELDTYFETFQSNILRGLFKELDDVVFHEQCGHDKYGLPIFV
eukprot:scaffold6034_cov50-Attheya_sp.AAC.2